MPSHIYNAKPDNNASRVTHFLNVTEKLGNTSLLNCNNLIWYKDKFNVSKPQVQFNAVHYNEELSSHTDSFCSKTL